MKKTYTGLRFRHIRDSNEDAKKLISEEASGEQLGLYSRYKSLNISMLKYFRFDNFVLIGGRSGSGKSAFWNILRNDFGNPLINLGNIKYRSNIDLGDIEIPLKSGGKFYPESRITMLTDGTMIIKPLNAKCKHDVVLVHIGPEMSAVEEQLRTVSGILGKSYGYILSSEYNSLTKKYNKLSSEEREEIFEIMDCITSRHEYYISSTGNVDEMYGTVEKVQENLPNSKIVFSLDHDFLTRRNKENSQEELIASVAELGVRVNRDFGAMVVYLHQLNNEIEAHDRLRNVERHYPSKKDLHFGSQLWWAVDDVYVIHVPAKLHLKTYGPNHLNTVNLCHLIKIKSRFGETGNVWLREELSKGRIHAAEEADFITSVKTTVAKRG